MAWTYDLTNLGGNRIAQVRLKLGDTDVSDPQLQDEEIDVLLDQTSSIDGAALLGARLLAARYARSVDKWVGDLKILASQRHRAYLDLADKLSATGIAYGMPSAGGIRVSEKETQAENDDLVSPSFVRGQHDNTEIV
jgi:hypothetical protein